MHANKIVQAAEKKTLKEKITPFRTGDTVRVHAKIKEGAKERIQYVEGVVIRKTGQGSTKTFTLRKISDGIGVEIIYPFHSPAVSEVEVVSHGSVRRSRLFYLRKLSGKAAKLKNKDGFGATEGEAKTEAK